MGAQERLTVEEANAGGLMAAAHIHRYEIAAELCGGLRVADVGCGIGYGSAILRRASPKVVGIDIDSDAIETARATYGDDGLVFEEGDAAEFLARPLSSRFDAIVMLETLEHLQDLGTALDALRARAAEGVRIVVSVPNSRAFKEENPYHVTDFGYDEAIALFEGFGDSAVLFQFYAEGSLIRGMNVGEATGRAMLGRDGDPEYANQFIGCINFGSEVAAAGTRMDLAAAPYNSRYMLDLERANFELRSANQRLARERLGTFDAAAATLLGRVDALSQELEAVKDPEQAAAHRSWIDELHRQIAELKEVIADMESSRVWRAGEAYRRVRGRLRQTVGR